MTTEKLIHLAIETGFANAALIETKDLIFLPSFRPLCAENLCGKYGVNYACPPDCGTVEEMKARVLKWTHAIVLQTLWDIDDPMDAGQTRPAKGCNLCDSCAITEGKPCRFPQQMFSCMSAYCIFVKDLADKCHMEYDCGPNITTFFSMYCFSPNDAQP